MKDRPLEGSPYFRVAPGDWSEIDDAIRADVVALQGMLERAVGGADDSSPPPLEVALKLSELASQLFDQLARDERDLRQVISTLRTAHAVAWDMHDAVQAHRITVAEHMRQLRETIDSFEDDLRALQVARDAA